LFGVGMFSSEPISLFGVGMISLKPISLFGVGMFSSMKTYQHQTKR
jgi:hypothetical protein